MKYLDDVDISSLPDDDKQKLLALYKADRFAFYRLWRDPAEAQRLCQAFEQQHGGTVDRLTVDSITAMMQYLKSAGAPPSVGMFYKALIDGRTQGNRKPKTLDKPVESRLAEIDKLEKRLRDYAAALEEEAESESAELAKEFDDPDPSDPYNPFADQYKPVTDAIVGNIDDSFVDAPIMEIEREHPEGSDEEIIRLKFAAMTTFYPNEFETLVKVINEYSPTFISILSIASVACIEISFEKVWIPN